MQRRAAERRYPHEPSIRFDRLKRQNKRIGESPILVIAEAEARERGPDLGDKEGERRRASAHNLAAKQAKGEKGQT
jgi:hypothetical protein